MGVHDVYCVICGIVTNRYHSNNDVKNLTKIINAGHFNVPSKSKYKWRIGKRNREIEPSLLKNYKKCADDIKKLENKFNWCDKNYLITHKKVIKNLNDFYKGDYGGFRNKKEYYETQGLFWEEKDNIALVCHASCHKLITGYFKYNLQIDDIKPKLNDHSMLKNYGTIVNRYAGFQDFSWIGMILNEKDFFNFETIMAANKKMNLNDNNIDLLSDPLLNINNAKRIIKIWTPLIKKIKSKPIKSIKQRPSPSESATLYKVGTKKTGNDKNKYIVVENKNKVKRWQKYKN